MTNPTKISAAGTPPALAELMAQYLRRQVAAQEAGWAGVESGAEVVPFEAVPVQPVDARLAWDEALTALELAQPEAELADLEAPPDWESLVAAQEPAMGLALCTGNYPQAVRDLHGLLRTADLKELRPGAARPTSAPVVVSWADGVRRAFQFPEMLVAAGVLRLAKQFALAGELLATDERKIPAAWRDAWTNERAALAWHQGQAEEAIRLWHSQAETVPVLFNRGMAALFSDQPQEARRWLAKAVAGIPEDSAWHHLGKLYLALAEMRS
jgi:tetratricopeptide (TPR) repeat protein